MKLKGRKGVQTHFHLIIKDKNKNKNKTTQKQNKTKTKTKTKTKKFLCCKQMNEASKRKRVQKLYALLVGLKNVPELGYSGMYTTLSETFKYTFSKNITKLKLQVSV